MTDLDICTRCGHHRRAHAPTLGMRCMFGVRELRTGTATTICQCAKFTTGEDE